MQLLVSVRSVEEANLAGMEGVDRIDLKEPRLGSLGATSPAIWQDVVARWHTRTRVSIALGELAEICHIDEVPQHADSVKVGLSGCRQAINWQHDLSALFDKLPRTVHRVAVHYADAHLANSPPLDAVLRMANELDCQTFLVDTFDKSAGSVFDHMSTTQLINLRQRVKAEGQFFAIAGSLRQEHLPSVVQIHPDIVAVRGVVCHRDRTGEFDAALLQNFRRQLERARQLDTRKVPLRS